MTDSFWKNAAASLPPHVRSRYAEAFEAMERYEALLDAVMSGGRRARRALGKGCQAAARLLDTAAQRLLLSR
ncbi:MAG TPA: hypothetical protein VMN03_01120 [Burkholderiales bacterium]|nr:hypothetical protein [Burkholderiales bacterium]